MFFCSQSEGLRTGAMGRVRWLQPQIYCQENNSNVNMKMCRWHWAALCCCSPGNGTDTSRDKDEEVLKCLCCVTRETGNVNVNPVFVLLSGSFHISPNEKGQFAPAPEYIWMRQHLSGDQEPSRLSDIWIAEVYSIFKSYLITQLFEEFQESCCEVNFDSPKRGKNAPTPSPGIFSHFSPCLNIVRKQK